jgi:DNA polymerase-3 subunit gamma/tau
MVLACGVGDALLLSVDDEQRGILAKHAASAGLQTILAAAQILAETKNRMKGATFSRVLIELALVRIATLDQLDNVAELIGQLRQGKAPASGPAAPSVARTTGAQTSGAASGASPARQGGRGNPAASAPQPEARREAGAAPLPVRVDSGQLAAVPQIGTSVARGDGGTDLDSERRDSLSGKQDSGILALKLASERIPFEHGREGEIWLQVIALLSDMARSNARNVCATAISGPNSLVLTFPASYDFSKQYFERSSEQLAKIERALEQVVGRPIKVSLAVDESIPPVRLAPAPSAPQAGQGERLAADGTRDPLVQRALSVFGATVVRVESGTGPGQ